MLVRREFLALAGAGLAWASAGSLGLVPASARAARTDATVGIRLEPPHLDPTAGAAAAIGEIVYANVMEGLTRIGPDGSVKPGLAESWDVAPDGRSILFRLRKGVTWHDGSPFTAEDVKFSLDRARAPDSVNPQKGLFEPIASVEVADPHTVRVNLSRPSGTLLSFLGWPAAVIVSPRSSEGNKASPVGTGPFRFSGWTKGASVDLVRNPSYWGTPARLDKVSFRIIGDASATYAALLAGDVDAVPIYPAPENLDQFRSDPRFVVVDGQTEGKTILALNNGRRPFDDVRARRAIAHAIDRKAIIDGAMYGTAQPIGSHFSPLDPGYVDLTGRYPHDPEKAKALLKEAGVADGLTLRLVLPPVDYARRSGEIIASQLKAVGITAEIVPVEWAQWLSDVFKAKNYDMTIVSHVEPLDLDIYARDDYYFNYANPEYKALIQEIAGTVDDARRRELYGKAQRILAEDSVNVFLFLLPKSGVWSAKLKGMWENAPIPVTDMTGVYWED
jgi:peptide/nickel transport system substrate-binding protein